MITINQSIAHIEDAIKNNNLEDAIKILLEITKAHKTLQKESLLQASKLKDYEASRRVGSFTSERLEIKRSAIASNLLELLEEVKKEIDGSRLIPEIDQIRSRPLESQITKSKVESHNKWGMSENITITGENTGKINITKKRQQFLLISLILGIGIAAILIIWGRNKYTSPSELKSSNTTLIEGGYALIHPGNDFVPYEIKGDIVLTVEGEYVWIENKSDTTKVLIPSSKLIYVGSELSPTFPQSQIEASIRLSKSVLGNSMDLLNF